MSRLKCLGNKIKTFLGAEQIDRYPPMYGYLYNWYAVGDSRNLANPTNGWRVASFNDWNTRLGNYLINTYPHITSSNLGDYLKSCRRQNSPLGPPCATTTDPYWVVTGGYGHVYGRGGILNINASGWRSSANGAFNNFRGNGVLWSSDSMSTLNARQVFLSIVYTYISYSSRNKKEGCTVRLCRDATVREQLLPDFTIHCKNYFGNDGKAYKTVKIGSLIWIQEELAETKFANGDLIPFEATPGQGNFSNAQWTALTTPALCLPSNNSSFVSFNTMDRLKECTELIAKSV